MRLDAWSFVIFVVGALLGWLIAAVQYGPL
jgi:uncharacterized membrane protein YciS (DUF1049 family)